MVKVFKFKSWRKKGVALPEVLEQYMSINPRLNVMPFCSQFIPMEVGSHEYLCVMIKLLNDEMWSAAVVQLYENHS